MAEKTWIKVRCGILDKKHRDKMGAAIWLYLYMLDNVDWGTGQLEAWKDGVAAKDLEISVRTLQGQRQKLQDEGYIECAQGFQCQVITIMRWIDPRSYSGKVHNQGTEKSVPSQKDGDQGTEKSVPMGTGFRVPIHTEDSVPLHIVHIKNHMLSTYGVEIPPELDHGDFQDTWFEWEEHRKQKKKKLTPLSVKKQVNELSKYSLDVVIKAINESIMNGWQGIFPEKYAASPNGKPGTTFERNMQAAAEVRRKYGIQEDR